jgi:chromosome segregation ATPase
MANLVLLEDHGDMRSENERLVADVKALESALHKVRQDRREHESEVCRLRSECDRWLSETHLLSKQVTDANRSKTKIERELEVVRAQLTSTAPSTSQTVALDSHQDVTDQETALPRTAKCPNNRRAA